MTQPAAAPRAYIRHASALANLPGDPRPAIDLDESMLAAAGVTRKAARQLSRPALLAVAAALECRQRIEPSDGHAIALFVACATGADIIAPYLEATRALEPGSAPTSSSIFSHGAGNTLDFLRLSVGNTSGHIARYVKVTGWNATYSGFQAGAFALRSAVRLLAAGRIANALVVGAESLAPATAIPDDESAQVIEAACAIWLASTPGASAPRWKVAFDPAPQLPEGGPGASTYFESCGPLLDLAWAVRRGPPNWLPALQAGSSEDREAARYGFVRQDRSGTRTCYAVERELHATEGAR